MDLIKADIFFFISSISVVILTVALIILFIYTGNILKRVKRITEWILNESDQVSMDLATLRTKIRAETFTIGSLIKGIRTIINRRSKK